MKYIHHKSGFTILETLIVVIIVGIILTITLGIGGTYLRNVEYRYEKEQLIGFMDNLIATVRTSNYRGSETYEYISVEIDSTTINAYIDTGTIPIDSLVLTESSLVFSSGSTTIRLFPYNIACAEGTNYSEVNDVIYVEDPIIVPFTQIALFSDLETCYELDLRLCKLQQVPCP